MSNKDYDYWHRHIFNTFKCDCAFCKGSTYACPDDGFFLLAPGGTKIKAACLKHNHQGTGMNCKRCRGHAFNVKK